MLKNAFMGEGSVVARLFERWQYERYVCGQRRQTRAKRYKDASFRLVPFARIVREHCPDLDASSPVLSIGPRNEIELDILAVEAGLRNVTAIDLWSGSPRIRRGDMHSMPFADRSFALIFASHVFEHAWDFSRVARECLRVLRPGGYIFSATPRDFTPNDHDRYHFEAAVDLLAYFAEGRPRVLYEENRQAELRVLFRVAA